MGQHGGVGHTASKSAKDNEMWKLTVVKDCQVSVKGGNGRQPVRTCNHHLAGINPPVPAHQQRQVLAGRRRAVGPAGSDACRLTGYDQHTSLFFLLVL